MDRISPQLPLDIRPDVKATFDTFHRGQNAELTSALLQNINGTLNGAFYLFAPSGAGKTHLLYAVCNKADEKGLKASFIPLDNHQNLSPEMLEGLELQHIVCLDNIDSIAGRPDWETAVFHLLNRIKANGNLAIICASCPHAELKLILPDLRSRLSWGLTYRISPLNDDEKIQALTYLSKQKGIEMTVEVANYIVRHFDRDTSALFQLLERLDEASLIEQRRLTIPFISAFLAN